jgi:hypothetical protein
MSEMRLSSAEHLALARFVIGFGTEAKKFDNSFSLNFAGKAIQYDQDGDPELR